MKLVKKKKKKRNLVRFGFIRLCNGGGGGGGGEGGGEGSGNRAHYTIQSLGNVDCTGGLRVGTGILCSSCCQHHVAIVLKSL